MFKRQKIHSMSEDFQCCSGGSLVCLGMCDFLYFVLGHFYSVLVFSEAQGKIFLVKNMCVCVSSKGINN